MCYFRKYLFCLPCNFPFTGIFHWSWKTHGQHLSVNNYLSLYKTSMICSASRDSCKTKHKLCLFGGIISLSQAIEHLQYWNERYTYLDCAKNRNVPLNKPKCWNNYFHFYGGLLLLLLFTRKILRPVPINLHTNSQSWALFLPVMQETRVWSLHQEYPLGKGKAIHSSTLAWRIPLTEKPGRLQFMGSWRVGHDWATQTHNLLLCWRSNMRVEWMIL